MTDLTKLIDANGMTALAGGQLKLYGILLAALLVFALSIGRKADRPDYLVQTPLEKRKLRKRTVTATLLILLLIPLTLFVGVYYFAGRKYYFISLLILLECITDLPVDLVRAIATFFFLWLIAEPMLEKLDRIKTKYGLAE